MTEHLLTIEVDTAYAERFPDFEPVNRWSIACINPDQCNGWIECDKPHEVDGVNASDGPYDSDDDAPWLEQTRPRPAAGECPPRGYDVATQRLRERQTKAAAAPSASQLDHVSAAYYRKAADSLDNAGHHASATLLRHVADDYDGGTNA